MAVWQYITVLVSCMKNSKIIEDKKQVPPPFEKLKPEELRRRLQEGSSFLVEPNIKKVQEIIWEWTATLSRPGTKKPEKVIISTSRWRTGMSETADQDITPWVDILNRLGAEGWELTTSIIGSSIVGNDYFGFEGPVGIPISATYIFKRLG